MEVCGCGVVIFSWRLHVVVVGKDLAIAYDVSNKVRITPYLS